MSDGLANPAQPPHAIAKLNRDGSALRNDGVELTAAATNPWYVLATVAGQHVLSKRDELHARNRRYWNGWMCQDMSPQERTALAKKLDLPEAELAPLSDDERQAVKKRFRDAFPTDDPENRIPGAGGAMNFRRVYFQHVFFTQKFHFAGDAYFHSAHFARDADFRAAHFAGDAGFGGVHFAGPADFHRTHFARHADFNPAHFAGRADFRATHFAGRADFRRAHFTGYAGFSKAHFAGNASFSDGAFTAATDFRYARFAAHVPEFYQRQMHQDTRFSEDKRLWPRVTTKNAEPGKQAYTRLRQIAAANQNPDLEHFFLRQEMRCKEALATGLDRGAFALYRLISDSGISVARPAMGLLIMWLVPGLLYLFTYSSQIMRGDVALSPLGPFGLSFANLFSFLGLNGLYFKEIIAGFGPWLSLIASAQTVAGVVLLFFLGLGLRNRFRLK